MRKQLRIDFNPEKNNREIKRYFNLSINEKINVKANSCGFQIIWLRSALTCWRNHLGTIGRYDFPDRLTEKYFLHYKINNKRRIYNPTQLKIFN